MGTNIQSKVVVIAGGVGCFEPRKPEVAGLEKFENGKGVNYMILDPEKYRNQKMIIAGGGDSALDWSIRSERGLQFSHAGASQRKFQRCTRQCKQGDEIGS